MHDHRRLDADWPFVPTATVNIARADGVYMYTPDGTRILDAAAGAICANVGHGRDEVADAVARALKNSSYLVPPFECPERRALVDRLKAEWLPSHLTRMYFCSGGSEAIDSAMRLARLHFVCKGEPSRYKVIGRFPSYHGTTIGTLAVSGHDNRRVDYEPLVATMPLVPSPYPLRFKSDGTNEDCGQAAAGAIEKAIEQEGPETIAAVIGEPVIGSSGGAIVPPDNYWPLVQEICKKYGVLLISDEVMTGFGRTGTKFAIEHWGLKPDILVSGKGLASGYAPLSGLFASDEVVAPIADQNKQMMFYTYGGHPAACAAADAVLEIVRREDLITKANEAGTRLMSALQDRLGDHPHVAEVRGKGLLLSIEIVKDRATLEPFAEDLNVTGRVVGEGLKRGVFYYGGGTGPVRDIVALGPPFTISPDEIDVIADTLLAAVDTVTKKIAS